MLTTNMDRLYGQLTGGGFQISPKDFFGAADFLCAEPAARSVTFPASFGGKPVDLTVVLVPHEGYYAQAKEPA